MSYQTRLAKIEDSEAVMMLYHSLIGTSGCTWSIEYPSIQNVYEDIQNDSLYCLCEDHHEIVAVAAAVNDRELDHLTWSGKTKKPCELARIGVQKAMHHQGLASNLLEYVIQDVKKRGFDSIHLLVSKTNPAALALYTKFGFECCGERNAYDFDWFCYELVL